VHFALPCLNHVVGRFAKYIWYVEIIVVLSHDITMFSCKTKNKTNIKYQNLIETKIYKLNLKWLKYMYMRKLSNNKVGKQISFT
jgi:hypothetical protein